MAWGVSELAANATMESAFGVGRETRTHRIVAWGVACLGAWAHATGFYYGGHG